MTQSTRRKPAPKRRPSASKASDRASRLTVRWKGFRTLFDFWGNEMRRYYQLETLANATERSLTRTGSFIRSSVQLVLGPAPLTALTFELFQEGRYQLIFRMTAVNAKLNREHFGLVVAKNAAECSALARTEYGNLLALHKRSPNHIVQPLRAGSIFLPDRRPRDGKGREVFAYVTRWLNSYHELGVDRDLQFFMNIVPPHKFTRAQTETLKILAVEIVASTYDPKRHTIIELPQVVSGDFVVSKPKSGSPKLRLIACRRLVPRMTPSKVIHSIIDTRWDWGGREFRLIPESPEDLVDGLQRALGKEQALQWFAAYRKAIEYKNLPETSYLDRAVLDELGIK